MLDRIAMLALQPALSKGAAALQRTGITADAVTLTGFAAGIAAAGAIALQAPLLGLALICVSRIADGLDGALARQTQTTDRGAFLDSVCDFLFYAAIPLAFAIADPLRNALPAAVLLASFIGTATSFLGFAVLAERRGLQREHYPSKGFYYLGGLTEGTETIACFALMCALPNWFPQFAYGFAALCALTICTRVLAGWRELGKSGSS